MNRGAMWYLETEQEWHGWTGSGQPLVSHNSKRPGSANSVTLCYKRAFDKCEEVEVILPRALCRWWGRAGWTKAREEMGWREVELVHYELE